MTNNEAIWYWESKRQKAAQYTDDHWDAEERHEHERYIEAMDAAIEAMRSTSYDVSERLEFCFRSGATMTIKSALKAVEMLYHEAKKNKYIKKPLAWALYQVWKQADRGKSDEEARKDA